MIAKRIKRNIKRKVNSISNELFGVSPSDVAYAVSAVKAIGDMAESGELAEPKSVGGATSIYLKQIEEDFPDFHNDDAEVAIKTFVTEYIDIQYNNKKDFTHSKVYKELLPQIKKHSQKCISDFVNVSYQCEEDGYYPRSFEDAFINVNLATLKKYQDQLLGLKNKDEIDTNGNIYDLTQKIIDKKSDFASSLLYVAYTDKSVEWTTPKYIWEGLEWLQTR